MRATWRYGWLLYCKINVSIFYPLEVSDKVKPTLRLEGGEGNWTPRPGRGSISTYYLKFSCAGDLFLLSAIYLCIKLFISISGYS